MVNLFVYNIVKLGFPFAKVPPLWSEDVRAKLIERGYEHLVEVEEEEGE